MSGYPATPCRLAAAEGYGAGLACRTDPSHQIPLVAITDAQYDDSPRRFAEAHTCPRCGGPVHVAWWGPLYRLDGRRYISHQLPPGAMFWSTWGHGTGAGHPCFYWDNCAGPHLHVVLPNGHHWDIDSRATNCTQKAERTHRCWVRVGDPPAVSVAKGGKTCAAGAGSILSGDYHGFLRDGVLTAG